MAKTAGSAAVLDRATAPADKVVNILAVRREALHALDRAVRTLLQRRIPAPAFSLAPARVEQTIYDEIFAAMPAAGGHWTVAVRRPLMPFFHSVESFAVTLEFDARERPSRFVVNGSSECASDDATLESLDAALARARQAGPLVTWAPSFVPGLSL